MVYDMTYMYDQNIIDCLMRHSEEMCCRACGPTNSKAPLPWIGIYAATASLACFIAITADAFIAFRGKKHWFPCNFFTLNAATLTLLAIAMKMPLDLSTNMYGCSDQLSKLSSTVLMCIVINNFMPSLGSMNDKEIVTNIAALGILVVTVVANVCIELGTDVIPYYLKAEHAAVNICLFMLFVISTFSAFTVATTKKYMELKYSEIHKTASSSSSSSKEEELEQTGKLRVEKLKENVKKYWMLAETGSPQFVMARSVTCFASGLICFLSALILVEAVVRLLLLKIPNAALATSDYRWSTIFIFAIQTAAVGVGVIGPVSRGFIAIKFKCSKKMSEGYKTELKPESYWTERLVEWKERPVVLRIQGPKFKKLVQEIKDRFFGFCIKFQIGIVVASKLILLISVFFIRMLLSCCRCCSELWRKSGHSSNNQTHTGPQSASPVKLDLRNYVLHLEGEEKLPESTLKDISNAADRFILKAKKKQPKNLTELLQKSIGSFRCIPEFDNDPVPSLVDSEEPPNCWALHVVTLTSIAIAIPKINKNKIDRLVHSVSEGLSYVRHVDKSVDAKENLKNIRNAADKVWLGVELYRKWFEEDLSKMALKGTSCRETFEILADMAQKIVIKFKTDINGGLMENPNNWPIKVIASNSMYRISKSLLLDDKGNNDQTNDDKLFEKLSDMIVGILGACLTNLPGVITMKCFSSAIEKREKSVQLAARLLGETEEILKILEQHQLLSLNVDQFESIDEWRAKMGPTNPSASPSSSSNDLAASGSCKLAADVELKA